MSGSAVAMLRHWRERATAARECVQAVGLTGCAFSCESFTLLSVRALKVAFVRAFSAEPQQAELQRGVNDVGELHSAA